jgi:quercetin dioxygenase-like cupin family protein
MIEQIQAVVTSVAADGSSVFERTGAVDPAAYAGRGGVEQWAVWGTADGIGAVGPLGPLGPLGPVGDATVADATITPVHAPPFPGPGGTRFFVVRLPAGFSGAFHTTDTIDYGVVIEGEIVLDLDAGGREVLPAGTCIVQRGTDHAWRNETTAPALIAFVVVGAQRLA